jgi:hypothetical protein
VIAPARSALGTMMPLTAEASMPPLSIAAAASGLPPA